MYNLLIFVLIYRRLYSSSSKQKIGSMFIHVRTIIFRHEKTLCVMLYCKFLVSKKYEVCGSMLKRVRYSHKAQQQINKKVFFVWGRNYFILISNETTQISYNDQKKKKEVFRKFHCIFSSIKNINSPHQQTHRETYLWQLVLVFTDMSLAGIELAPSSRLFQNVTF